MRVRGVDDRRMRAALREFAATIGTTLEKEVMIAARVTAVSLATSVQPYGKTKAAKDTGEKAVERDIRRVFGVASSANVYDRLESEDPANAARFWRAWKARDAAEMQLALDASASLSQVRVLPTPDAGMHDARRTSRNRRVRGKTPDAVVMNQAALRKYIAERKKRVGLTKAGFALAAEQVGGVRGIPAWAQARKHPEASGGARVKHDPKRPWAEIRNTTPWLREVLPMREVKTAKAIAEEKLAKRMKIIIRKQARSI